MDAGPLITLLIGTFALIGLVWLLIRRHSRERNSQDLQQTHTPHAPNAGYDHSKAINKGVKGDYPRN
jgi:hypothetical protein